MSEIYNEKMTISPSHRYYLNSIAGKIAGIYNDDELGNNLKHDIVCRLICTAIGANSVSILLYQGTKDNIFCAGRYIDPWKTKAQSVSDKEGREIIRIMKRVTILEFLTLRKYAIDVQSLSQEFFDKLYYDYEKFEYSNPIKLSRSEFISFLKIYANPKEKKIIEKNYAVYLNNIRDDRHAISLSKPITGAFYYALTHLSKNTSLKQILSVYDKIKVFDGNIITADLNDFPDDKLCSDNLLNKLNVKIDTDAIYIGIPLIINSRAIGVLRIVINREIELKLSQITYENDNEIDPFTFKDFESCIEYITKVINIETISLLISMFIENLFFADGMRDISLKDALNRDINNLPVIADELAKVVNCFGCIIRLSNSPLKNAAIQGFSPAVSGYVKALELAGDPYITKDKLFLPILTDLLYNKSLTESLKNIQCLKVDLDNDGFPSFTYLTLDKNSRLISSENWDGILNSAQRKELTKTFTATNKIFDRFDIKSVIQIPIKDQEYGFVTFANTSNRTFITKDIEMLIPVINRLGLALKYDSSLAKAENASKEEIQKSQRVIYHQLLSPIVSMRNNFKNIQTLVERKDYTSLDIRTVEIVDTLDNSIDFITLNQYLSSFFTEKKILPKFTTIVLSTFLIKKVRTYQVHAKYHRGIEISVNGIEKPMPLFNTDPALLSHIIQALVDNAIKYSYSYIRGQYSNEQNPLYTSAHKPKFIHVNVHHVENEFTIQVENWGCRITENDKKNILNYMQRGDFAKNFEENGTGIGLFLVNAITEALNGKLSIECDDDHTVIILKFRQ